MLITTLCVHVVRADRILMNLSGCCWSGSGSGCGCGCQGGGGDGGGGGSGEGRMYIAARAREGGGEVVDS